MEPADVYTILFSIIPYTYMMIDENKLLIKITN